ncbi:MAG: DNA recombination protein RmuC [Clostridia bacterium]|nr:DNA recombination protein RmuC [Clostridia bacterium]
MIYLLIAVLIICVVNTVLCVVLMKKGKNSETEELSAKLNALQNEIRRDVEESNNRQLQNINSTFSDTNRMVVDSLGRFVSQIQKDNAEMKESVERNLDRINKSVTEQLEENLQNKLDSSFSKVNESLTKIYAWLGDMKELSTGVTDLKKVLTGVKTRGGWGEASLDAILEQILTTEQYGKQVKISGANLVDFAVILPGKGENDKVLLPIDAKFPVEDYQRLCDAQDSGDSAGVEKARRDLVARVKHESISIRDKYVKVPKTTDFAIMYVPTEGLFAELLRSPGLVDDLQKNKVVLAGPTTITALLNSLRMGFRTLAIEKRSTEIGRHLMTFQREFTGYMKHLGNTNKHLNQAQDSLSEVIKKSEKIQDKLQRVENLPGFEEEGLSLPVGDENEG